MQGKKIEQRIGSANEVMTWYYTLKEKPVKEIWTLTPVQIQQPQGIHLPNAAPAFDMIVSCILVFNDKSQS